MAPIVFKIRIDGKVHTVPARENPLGLAGIWCDGKLYEPCPQAVRDAMPSKWLPALGRTNGKWWFPDHIEPQYFEDEQSATFPSLKECSLYLYHVRTHKQLAHLRAIPYYVPEQNRGAI